MSRLRKPFGIAGDVIEVIEESGVALPIAKYLRRSNRDEMLEVSIVGVHKSIHDVIFSSGVDVMFCNLSAGLLNRKLQPGSHVTKVLQCLHSRPLGTIGKVGSEGNINMKPGSPQTRRSACVSA